MSAILIFPTSLCKSPQSESKVLNFMILFTPLNPKGTLYQTSEKTLIMPGPPFFLEHPRLLRDICKPERGYKGRFFCRTT
jgi:hypothetical protein